MGDASLWAEYGGLIGLIIFALFMTIIIVITSNRSFLKDIMKEDRQERRADRQAEALERLADRTEHKESFNKLTAALEDLTDELKKR